MIVCCFVRLLGVGLATVGLVVGLCFVGGVVVLELVLVFLYFFP